MLRAEARDNQNLALRNECGIQSHHTTTSANEELTSGLTTTVNHSAFILNPKWQPK